jgi:hypothetical protein
MKSIQNFIEKLHQIQKLKKCEDLHDLSMLLGNSNKWNEEQYSNFETFLWFIIKKNEDIKKVTFENFSAEYNNITEEEWNYLIKCILNY